MTTESKTDAMSNEIERKFLVKEMPAGLENYPSSYISQGYIAATDDGIEVRIRRKGERYYETVKSGKGLKRRETEAEIGEKTYRTLWPLTEGMRIEKTRYEIHYEGHLIELDVYSGALEGLVVAEVEFPSEEESARFTPPDWFGREVTDDPGYKNRNLAVYGKPEKS